MADEYVYNISSRYLQKWAEIWYKTCQKQALFTSVRDFTVIFRILFFDRFWCFKKCYRVIFRVLCENLTLKNMYRSSNSRICFAWPFLPGDLTWPWPLLWSQSTVNDTYKCQRHYPCRVVGFVWACHRNFARWCHQARKVENSDFDLICDVISDIRVKFLNLYG